MDLCIKTVVRWDENDGVQGFNPCFNGSMYKNTIAEAEPETKIMSFNPCFNGSMYKNSK